MKEIKCQHCGPEDLGCKTCGGYKYLIQKTKCTSCGHDYWVRPGARTTYEGKRWHSFDGLELVIKNGILMCKICEDK